LESKITLNYTNHFSVLQLFRDTPTSYLFTYDVSSKIIIFNKYVNVQKIRKFVIGILWCFVYKHFINLLGMYIIIELFLATV